MEETITVVFTDTKKQKALKNYLSKIKDSSVFVICGPNHVRQIVGNIREENGLDIYYMPFNNTSDDVQLIVEWLKIMHPNAKLVIRTIYK